MEQIECRIRHRVLKKTLIGNQDERDHCTCRNLCGDEERDRAAGVHAAASVPPPWDRSCR
jgi:hypothetical protein